MSLGRVWESSEKTEHYIPLPGVLSAKQTMWVRAEAGFPLLCFLKMKRNEDSLVFLFFKIKGLRQAGRSRQLRFLKKGTLEAWRQ